MRTHFFWVLATLIITACNNKQKENDNTASDDSKIWNELPTVAAEGENKRNNPHGIRLDSR